MEAQKPLDESLAELSSNEERLRHLLDVMRGAIEQNTSPQFKAFWAARERCIPLFKEGIHPAVRSLLWQQYRDLSQEARMLSDLLGEQAAFAGEQIKLALDAIEAEMAGPIEGVDLPLFESRTLRAERKTFEPLYAELFLLNRWTERLVAFRKELVGTEMRMRDKNALFKRLALLGDRAFPRRKELLEEVSTRFLALVDRFVQGAFPEEGLTAPYYVIKNEIKALQAFAKTVTLTASAFKEARVRLSGCWDQIRVVEKGKQEEERERRAAAKEVAKAKREAAEEEKRAFEAYAAKSREQTQGLREKIKALIEEGRHLTGDELASKREALAAEIAAADLANTDRKGLEDALGRIAELMVDAEESAFLKTPDDHPDVASRLQMVLERKRGRRSGIKECLEDLRKEAGGSGLDFELALTVDRRIQEEREKLQHLDITISEIQGRLKSLQD